MIIYKITNLINGKCYVGQTRTTLQERWKHHRHSHGCSAIHSALIKYGFDNFTIEEIDQANTQEELNQKEQYWIGKLNTLSPNGYNLTTGGESPNWCNESKMRMSESKKGTYPSEETRTLLSEVKKGSKNSFYGRHHTEESKAKISKSKLGQKPWITGKHWSDDDITKLRLGQKTCKKVRCVETGIVYDSIRQAAKELNLYHSNISKALQGKNKTSGSYHWEYVTQEVG